jgi:hypothetical protein
MLLWTVRARIITRALMADGHFNAANTVAGTCAQCLATDVGNPSSRSCRRTSLHCRCACTIPRRQHRSAQRSCPGQRPPRQRLQPPVSRVRSRQYPASPVNIAVSLWRRRSRHQPRPQGEAPSVDRGAEGIAVRGHCAGVQLAHLSHRGLLSMRGSLHAGRGNPGILLCFVGMVNG